MKVYDTNYGPDIFERIRSGIITEMFLTYEGYLKPEIGDHLRISCVFKGVVWDVCMFSIRKVADSEGEIATVMIQVMPIMTPLLSATTYSCLQEIELKSIAYN